MSSDYHFRMTRPRSRMLTFRVTDQEYEQLQTASVISGARCLSEFLRRTAMDPLARSEPSPNLQSATMEQWPPPQGVTDRLSNFEERVHVLEGYISDLLELPFVQRGLKVRRSIADAST